MHQFRDGFFPAESAEIKAWFEGLKGRIDPDVILTHHGDDAHQDHREVNRLTWNTFRDHTILEYEIPKWDGDLGRPNVYVPLDEVAMTRKIELLIRHFGTPALQALVRCRDVPRARPPARHGMPRTGPLRRGLPRAQAGADLIIVGR